MFVPRLKQLRPDKFTAVPHTATDTLPTLESLGLLVHLNRHTDDYLPSIDDLVTNRPGITRRTAQKARGVLLEHGYYISVRFRHDHRGRFATDIWRATVPHTADDLAEIARRYAPGTETEIVETDQNKQPVRDRDGKVRMRTVRIRWAQVESWRGEQIVSGHGQLVDKSEDSRGAGSGHPVTTCENADTSGASRGAGSGHSAQPAKTSVSPGRADLPLAGGSVSGRSTRRSGEKTKEHHHAAAAAGDDDELSPEDSTDGERDKARQLLAELRMPSGPPFSPNSEAIEAVRGQLAAGWSPGEITEALTHGVQDYRKPAAGVMENVRSLPSRMAARSAENGPQRQESARPPWCGECDEEDRRIPSQDGGLGPRCRRCHPNPSKSKSTSQGSGRSQEAADQQFLGQLLGR